MVCYVIFSRAFYSSPIIVFILQLEPISTFASSCLVADSDLIPVIITAADPHSVNITVNITPSLNEKFSSLDVYTSGGSVKGSNSYRKVGSIINGSQELHVDGLEPQREYSIGIVTTGRRQGGGIFLERKITTSALEDCK